MAYIRKTCDRWDIMHYIPDFGWDCECSAYTYHDARQTLREYRENMPGLYKLEKHREPIVKKED